MPAEPSPRPTRRYFHGALNFEQQRKQAKELLKEFRDQDPTAAARFVRAHPQGTTLSPAKVKLADAQLVLARENGFASWPRLKAHCDGLAEASRQIAAGEATLLDSADTLHLRCGSDIRHALSIAGFHGRFLEFADPFCQGPVPAAPREAFIETRARFIAAAYGLRPQDALARQTAEYQALQDLPAKATVVLWFEHDSYDQLVLAFLLNHFSAAADRPGLELICVDEVPGVPDFTGLGQLAPALLRWLWLHRRAPVSEDQLQLGQRVWSAFTAPRPDDLYAIARDGTPALPTMAGALRRHLQELPSTHNGLSLTQQLMLQILADEGPLTGGALFGRLTSGPEPLPFLGDLMFWHVLADLGQASRALYQVDGDDGGLPWPKRRLAITETGRDVLAGKTDFLSLYRGERWVGGVRIRDDGPCPRWDPANGRLS